MFLGVNKTKQKVRKIIFKKRRKQIKQIREVIKEDSTLVKFLLGRPVTPC